ncbi:hypothetical protein [Gilvimarinus chinensis]|uniref:hypothetical protein n=1 Tax=Gilvimarinus chinensis TaxID=396005 RepID=UPI00035F07C8|nr:hypothetical protein [Gilvimarinus chinensis]
MVASQGSILAGVRSPRPDFAGQLMGAMAFNQDMQMGKQRQQMNEQAIRMNDQAIQQNEQAMNAPSRPDLELANTRARFYVRAADHLLSLPPEQRMGQVSQWAQSGMLQQLGIDLSEIKPESLTDRGLQGLQAQMRAVLPDGAQSVRAQSSENLPGGYTKIVMSDGSVQVKSPSGETLSGQEAVDAVRSAYDYGVELENRIYGAREGGKLDTQIEKRPEVEDRVTRAKKSAEQAETKIGELFNQYQGIQNTISSYDEIIGLIDRGADTGAIASRLPSVRAASIELDNAVNNLGLDVIGNTTFGALSESELGFALDSAIPRNLQGPELKDWLTRKKAAQQKLANYVNGAIRYLGNGGTLAGLQQQRTQQSGQGGSSQAANTKTFNWEDLPE